MTTLSYIPAGPESQGSRYLLLIYYFVFILDFSSMYYHALSLYMQALGSLIHELLFTVIKKGNPGCGQTGYA